MGQLQQLARQLAGPRVAPEQLVLWSSLPRQRSYSSRRARLCVSLWQFCCDHQKL